MRNHNTLRSLALSLCLLTLSGAHALAHDFEVRGPSASEWSLVHSEIAKGWATNTAMVKDHVTLSQKKVCLTKIGGITVDKEIKLPGQIQSTTIVTGSVFTYCQ